MRGRPVLRLSQGKAESITSEISNVMLGSGVWLRSTPDVIAALRAAPLICLGALGTYHQSAGRAQRGGLAQRSGANPIKHICNKCVVEKQFV